jgi:ATP-dependent DNA helicase RecG
MGTGLYRMKDICKRENAPYPKVEFDENYFYVTFTQSNEYIKIAGGLDRVGEKGVEKGVESLKSNEKIIVDLIKGNRNISKKALMEQGKLTKKTVEYNISQLKKKGIIKRIGPDRGGHWEIVG